MIIENRNNKFKDIVWDKTLDSFRIIGGQHSVIMASSKTKDVLGLGIKDGNNLEIGVIMVNESSIKRLLESRNIDLDILNN